MTALISPPLDWRGRPPRRYDDITISAVRVAFVLSLLIHAAVLWTYLPKMRLLTPSDNEQGESGSPLAVRLANPMPPAGSLPSTPPPPEPKTAAEAPAHATPPPKVALRPPTPPRVMTIPRQTPAPATQPVTPPEPPQAPPQPVAATDLAAYIEARRLARGEQPSSAQESSSDSKAPEDDTERRNRIVAANLGINSRPSFGKDSRNGGGVFQIKTLEYTYAEFWFYGWNKDISRNSKQVIEVRKGDASDIRLAVIRKMIGIVREHETGDFLWESHRLGKQITLSARTRDTAELEAFMMQEFFFDERNPP
jgi:hypothetical protein